jgi:hypothetical protein
LAACSFTNNSTTAIQHITLWREKEEYGREYDKRMLTPKKRKTVWTKVFKNMICQPFPLPRLAILSLEPQVAGFLEYWPPRKLWSSFKSA